MPRVSEIYVFTQREQPVLSVRTRCSVQNLPNEIDKIYGELFSYLDELDTCSSNFVCDMPFVAYYNMDMNDMDVEIGVPTVNIVPEKGRLKARTIPQQKYVSAMYRGEYKDIGCVYEDMSKWIIENKYIPEGISYEYYYNEPNSSLPESELITKVVMPLK